MVDEDEDVTTIKVKTGTWKRLNQMKEPGDSFDEILKRLLNEVEDNPDDCENPTATSD